MTYYVIFVSNSLRIIMLLTSISTQLLVRYIGFPLIYLLLSRICELL